MNNNSNFKLRLQTHAWIGSRRRRVLTGLILTAILLGVTQSQFDLAGASIAPPQAMDPAKVAAAIKGNAQALKAFIWQQRLQLQVKGETKKVTLNQMNYDMNGNLQKTLLSEQPAAEQSSGGGRGGRLKQRIIKKKTDEFKEMMEGIASLVKSYAELPPDQLQAALKQAAFSQGTRDMQGAIQIQMRNVIHQGDSLTLWIDQASMLFRKIVITTKYEGNPVTATANYDMLPSGQVYMAKAVLNYPKKAVVVGIDNLNYQQAR